MRNLVKENGKLARLLVTINNSLSFLLFWAEQIVHHELLYNVSKAHGPNPVTNVANTVIQHKHDKESNNAKQHVNDAGEYQSRTAKLLSGHAGSQAQREKTNKNGAKFNPSNSQPVAMDQCFRYMEAYLKQQQQQADLTDDSDITISTVCNKVKDLLTMKALNNDESIKQNESNENKSEDADGLMD